MRTLLKRAHHYVVKPARQITAQFVRRRVAITAYLFRRQRNYTFAVTRRFFSRAGYDIARLFRLFFADDARDLVGRPVSQPIWAVAGEQLVEQHAEAVLIGGRGHLLAARLFGTGVFGRHHPHRRYRRVNRVGDEVGVEDLGDAEIEQLRRPVFGDQYVARFDVAVDNLIFVRVMRGGADQSKEPESFRNGQPPRVAVAMNRQTFDVLHHEIRQAVVGRSAVEQSRDIGVI